MRIARYAKGETVGYGCQREDGSIVAINGDPLAGSGPLGPGGTGAWSLTRRIISGARLLAPVALPAVVCIGLNYRRHAEESGNPIPDHPVVFMKMPSSVQDPGGPIAWELGLPAERSCGTAYRAILTLIVAPHLYPRQRSIVNYKASMLSC